MNMPAHRLSASALECKRPEPPMSFTDYLDAARECQDRAERLHSGVRDMRVDREIRSLLDEAAECLRQAQGRLL